MASTDFIETPRFPDPIAQGSSGGPRFDTAISEMRSGAEQRFVNWSFPRHEYDIARGIQSHADLYDLLEFYMSVRGRGVGFRFRDPLDYKSCAPDQTISALDNALIPHEDNPDYSKGIYYLVKRYNVGNIEMVRRISKPEDGSVVVGLDGSELGESYYSLTDSTQGIVEIDSTAYSNSNGNVTAGFRFDVPVRFDTDTLEVNYESYNSGEASVPLIEVRDGV